MTSIVLAGGGSAGHTSPLIATAQWLQRLDPGVEITAVGTPRGLETRVIPDAGLPLELISPVPLPRRPSVELVRVPLRLRRAIHEAGQVLARSSARVAVGFGGYASIPVYLAARRAHIPVVVHEQNALPGLANKVAARFTPYVATTFPHTPLPHARCVGLPLRSAIESFDREALRPAALRQFDLEPGRPTLLVSGGSQGARSINAAVLGARFRLLADGISILHVLGPKNLMPDIVPINDPQTGARYRPVAYVDAMESAYAVADLMLARAGAGTVAEAGAIGLPCVFVPLPHGNGEQARNARPVVDAGGGVLLADADCTAERLADLLPGLLGDEERRRGMGTAASGVISRDGGRTLAEWILQVAG